MSKEEFSIMEDNPPRWRNFRYDDKCHRHEIFFGRNRQKSIEDGMVIFLEPESHNMSNYGIHFNNSFDLEVKKIAQKRWMEHYNKTKEDFIERYGKNYL